MKNIQTKRLFAFLLTAAMLLSMICIAPLSASAETSTEIVTTTSGDYEYTVLDDGTAQITKYNGNEAELSIPTELDSKKVTSIGDYSFEKCKSITSLTIPAGISVGKNAFRYCENIKNLTLSDGVTTINNGAFSFCNKLESLVLPDSITTLGNNAFQECKALKSLKLPDGLEKIGDFAFADCENLSAIEIPSGIKEIGQNAFAHCYGFTSVVIPENVKLIGTSAFSYCKNLTSVTLNEGIETIDGFAFSSCTSLMEVTVPDSVKQIERLAFGYWFNEKTWNDELVSGFVLKGYKGSAADIYANGCGVKFESIGNSVLTPPTEPIPTDPPEPTDPPVPGTVITIYYKNTNNFSTPYAYYWPEGGAGPVAWAGVAMTKVTDDVYKVDVPVENNMIIFSDNGKNQTGDIAIGGNNQIYDNGWKYYEDVPIQPSTTEPQETTAPATTEPGTTEPQETTVPVTTEPGTTEPTDEPSVRIYGDVNCDGYVKIDDATEIQRAAASLVTLTELQMLIGDVNRDGKTDVSDVTLIQKYIAEYDVEIVGEKIPQDLLFDEVQKNDDVNLEF